PSSVKTLTTALITLLIVAGLTADVEVEVRPLVGDGVAGRLTDLSGKKLTVETTAGTREFDNLKLMWIQVPGVAPTDKTAIWIDLIDGSRLIANSFVAVNGVARITVAGRPHIEIPTRSIHTVRFRQQSPELAVQWREITSSQASGDMIVTRKTSARTI